MVRPSVLVALFVLAPASWAGSICNTPPQAVPDLVRVGYSSSHLFEPLHSDRDADGDPLVLVSIADPQVACRGRVESLGGGLVRFVPTGEALPGGALSCDVAYTVSDGHTSRSSQVTLLFPPSLLFADDFESGTTAAWGAVVAGL